MHGNGWLAFAAAALGLVTVVRVPDLDAAVVLEKTMNTYPRILSAGTQASWRIGLIIGLCLPAARSAAADEGLVSEQATVIMQAWVDETTGARPGATSALPAGTVVDRVVVANGVAVAYVTMPADNLSPLPEERCEAIVRELVARLRRLDGIRGFAIHVRPDTDPDAAYQPLPSYLARPEGELDKPETEPADGDQPLRGGGLPAYNPGQPAGALSGKTVFLSPGHGWYYSATLGRWATQRGNSYGIIEDHSNGEAVFHHLARYLHNAGANVWPCRERDFNTNMVIIDNDDGPPDFETTGDWPTSTAAGTWKGDHYQYHAVSASETAVATYTPSFPESGYYAVYIWTPSASNRSTDARVRVNHTGGTTTHIINMQQDGNTWRFLGLYRFNAGRDGACGSLEISNQGSDPTKYVIADAVRFGGGLGDYVDGGSTSGWPRWEESGRYFGVFMGHTDTPYGTVSAMPRYAKWESESWEDSVYVSWHTNATGSSAVGHGTDVYVYGPNGPPSPFSQFSGVQGSDTLATYIRDEIVNDLRIAWNDPAWPGDLFSAWFGELNPTYNNEMPSVLIEVAFHDSEVDADSIVDPRFRDLVSRAVYQSIVKWWHREADGPSSTPTPTETLVPEPPTHLSVRNVGDGRVRVAWHTPPFNEGDDLLGDAATGYLVQISEDGYGFDDGTPTTGLSIDFDDLEAGAIRFFRVIATNEGGQSFPSAIGGVNVQADATSPVLIVNGFDRMDRFMLLSEDDPYDADPLRRERPERMNHYGYIRTFAEAMRFSGVAFDSAANEAVRDLDVPLGDYAAVIWQCGEESSRELTFDFTEQVRVEDYLNGGGQMFVSGAEIGWDLVERDHGADFYRSSLKGDYIADDAETYGVTSVAGSPFVAIGTFSFDNGAAIYDVDWPDVVGPFGGSSTALTYVGGTGGSAAVVYDADYRLVHFGFPFETITDASIRAAIMTAVLDFFHLDPLDPPRPPPDDIILESRDAAGTVTPAPAYVEDGAWMNSSIKSAAPGLTGTGSRFITYEIPNPGTDNATFVPEIMTPGRYEVFVTWANGANCYDARHRIRHYHGTTDLLVDQIPSGAPEPPNYDQWISLGSYWFLAGRAVSNASMNVSEETVTGRPSPGWNLRVYADAVKWVFVEWWPSGDYDGDRTVGLDDYVHLPGCLTGLGTVYADPACEAFDLDLDGDVDLRDLGGFQQSLGSGLRP